MWSFSLKIEVIHRYGACDDESYSPTEVPFKFSEEEDEQLYCCTKWNKPEKGS